MKNSKRFIAIFTAILILVGTCQVFGSNNIKATAQAVVKKEEIKAAFEAYVAEVGNHFTIDNAVKAINNKIGADTVSCEKKADAKNGDYFIKHAVDGVYDEDEVEEHRLSIPGHDGYVAAVLKINATDEYVGVTAKIPHKEVNLGKLVKEVYSADNKNFDAKNNDSGVLEVYGYNGTAEKIVFPSDFYGHINMSKSTGLANIKVIISNGLIRNIRENAFKSCEKLVAVDIDGGFKAIIKGAFSHCANLKYFKFPTDAYFELTNENAIIQENAFYNSQKLQNIGTLPDHCVIYNNAFVNTAILDYYFSSSTADESKTGNKFYLYPTVNPHQQVIMKYDDLQKATLSRAVTLGMEALDKYAVSISSDADTIKAAFTDGYSGKTANGYEGIITADWNGTFTKSEDSKVGSGILTVSNGGKSFDIFYEYDLRVGLSRLEIKDFDITPEFNKDVYEYTVTVPFNTEKLEIIAEGLNENIVIGEITGNGNFQVGSDNLIKIPVTGLNSESAEYNIRVKMLSEDETSKNQEAAKIAFDKYVEQNGNDSTAEGLKTYLSAELNKTVKIENSNFYVKYAVDGAVDEDPDPETRIDIKGSDGAVAAAFTVDGAKYAFTAVIKHKVENLGKLTIAKLGDYPDPNDSSKVIINWIGNGKQETRYKVVLPKNTSYINVAGLKFEGDDSKNIVAMVMLGHQSEIPRYYEFSELEAVVMADTIKGIPGEGTSNSINQTFKGCKKLKYVHFSQGWTGIISWGMFKNCTSLVNINIPSTVTGYIEDQAFKSTAIREITIPNISLQNDPFATPTGDAAKGRNVNKIGEKMSLLKAAAFITNNINNVDFDSTKTGDALKNEILGSFGIEGGLTYEWSEFGFTNGDDYIDSVLHLSDGEYSFHIDYFRNLSGDSSLKELSLKGFELSPKFSPETTDYTINVVNSVKKLKLVATKNNNKATLGTIENLETLDNLPEGETVIKVPVTAQNGNFTEYKITINRSSVVDPDDTAEKRLQDAISNMQLTEDEGNEEGIIERLEIAVHDGDYQITVDNLYKIDPIEGAMDKNGILVPAIKGSVAGDVTLTNTNSTTEASKTFKLTASVDGGYKLYEFASVSKASDFEVSEDGRTLVSYTGNAEKVVLPEGIEEINKYWMASEPDVIKALILPENLRATPSGLCWGMKNLEVCYMGDLVSVFGGQEFQKCYKLRHVKLSAQAPTISYAMFEKTFALADLYVPTTVTTVSTNAFLHSFIRDIVIPGNATNIWGDSFSWLCYNPHHFTGNEHIAKIIEDEDEAYIKSVIKDDLSRKTVNVKILNPSIAYQGNKNPFGNDIHNSWSPVKLHSATDSTTHKYSQEKKADGTAAHPGVSFSALDMSINEVLARAKQALDYVFVSNDTVASDILKGVKASYYSSEISQDFVSFDNLKITPATKTSQGNISGELKLVTVGGGEYVIALNRQFNFVPDLIPVEDEEEEDVSDYEDDYDDEDDYFEEYQEPTEDSSNEEQEATGHWEQVAKTKKVKVKAGVQITDYTWIVVLSIVGGVLLLAGGVIAFILIRRKKKAK